MLAWKKIMGEFEVGHWMGAKKRGGWNAGYRNFEKGLEKKKLTNKNHKMVPYR